MGAAVMDAGLGDALRRSWPMWLLAFSLNGFFLYLALLDAVDVEPRSPLTATYYALVGAGLVLAAWQRREVIIRRLRPRARLVTAFAVAATVLAGWFLLNTAIFSDGELAMRLAGLLVLWTIPASLVALSLEPGDLTAVAQGLVALALLLVPIEILALGRAGTDVFRFTPIADLDVISAGLVPAVGAVAALSLEPASLRGRVAQLSAAAMLAAASIVPGSRGPVLALVVGVLALGIVQPRRHLAVSLACIALGLGLGSIVGSHVGSFGYLSSAPSIEPPSAQDGEKGERGAISTLSIRRQWLEQAIRDTPDRPLFGHGVGMFADRTPEARLMGVSGQRTYPHNTFVEAAYSLGVLGLLLFVVFVGAAVVALVAVVRLRDRGQRQALPFLVGLGAFAFANTNISGEIGQDALLWSAAALAVALYADARRDQERAPQAPDLTRSRE